MVIRNNLEFFPTDNLERNKINFCTRKNVNKKTDDGNLFLFPKNIFFEKLKLNCFFKTVWNSKKLFLPLL